MASSSSLVNLSGSSLVLHAAHEEYLASARTPADWADFIDSLQHALAPIEHAMPAGQVNLATAGVELPKNGAGGSGAGASSVGSGGLQSTAARYEALVDELYLTQGYRHTQHARLGQSIACGSSLTNGAVTPLRFLSATCYRYLKDLFAQQDPTLEAIFTQYRDVGGATNPAGYQDFLHSLITLSQRWKRYIFFRPSSETEIATAGAATDADGGDYLKQSRALFALLEEFLQRGLITHGECEFLEVILYNLSTSFVPRADEDDPAIRENPFLLAAWSVTWEALQSANGGGQDPDPQVAAAAHSAAAAEFYDSLLHLLENQIQRIHARYGLEAIGFLRQLEGNINYHIPPASMKHLRNLLAHEAKQAERRAAGDVAACAPPTTPQELAIDRQLTLLFVCFAESAASQNVYELIETLQMVGASWRARDPHAALLQCVRFIESEGMLTPREADRVELFVYEKDAFLLAAWSVYEATDYSKVGFQDFLESIRIALDREFRAECATLAKEGYQLVNSWSVRPDARPRLHDDPLRDEVLGIRRAHYHEDGGMTGGDGGEPRSFHLPAGIRGTLSQRSSEVVRFLLQQRDHVLLALLAEYYASAPTTEEQGRLALHELLDGVERLIARVEFGSAAEAAEVVRRMEREEDSQQRREEQEEEDQQQRRQRQQQRQEQPPQQQEEEEEGSSSSALDIYQLSQMLLSLQSDGYLSHDTLVQLLHAVQDLQDPVLLAAFSLYKSQLARGDASRQAWPDLWDTLQRVWQRIQQRQGIVDSDDDEQEEEHKEEDEEDGGEEEDSDDAFGGGGWSAEQGSTLSYLSPPDAVLLRHVGAELLDDLSRRSSRRNSSTSSGSGARAYHTGPTVSVTDMLYLRDLLRTGDPTLYAIISLAHEGARENGSGAAGDAAEEDGESSVSLHEIRDSLEVLGRRWLKELSAGDQLQVKLLDSLAQSKLITPSALDYMLGLVYARDPTLAAAYAVYAEAAAHEDAGTDSETREEDSDIAPSEFEEDEVDEDDEDGDDDDDDDDEYEYDDSSDADYEDDELQWQSFRQPGDEAAEADATDDRNEAKYNSESPRRGPSSVSASAGASHHQRRGSTFAFRGHHRTRSSAIAQSLSEYVDSVQHIVSNGQRAMGGFTADASPSDEDEWDREAERIAMTKAKDPTEYGLPYFEA